MLVDYCGAGSRLSPERGLVLDPDRWAWMPKIDGVYARLSTDRRGRIANVIGRSGHQLAEGRDLLGIVAGPGDSVLHAELEAHTEAGNRAAARGWRCAHVFDCTRLDGRDVSRMPYGERYALLCERQAATRDLWSLDSHGDAHDLRTGRYVVPAPRDVRRLPLVDLERDGRALWDAFVEREGGEGLVAVRLDAPAGLRGSKRKIKASDTLDCTVLSAAGGAAMLCYGNIRFAVSARGRWSHLEPGAIVEVACDGWYERGATPRFARLVRLRTDLA